MNSKLSLTNKLGAVVISLITIPALLISLFTIPIEVIVFDPSRYYPVLDQDVYKEEFPKLVSELISSQLFNINEDSNAEYFDYQEKMSAVLVNYLSSDWLDEVAGDVINKTVAYFNFKTPYDSIEVNILELKNSILQNSISISEEYMRSMKNCSALENAAYSGNEDIVLKSINICNPSISNKETVINALDLFIQDKVNQLPSSINVFGVIPSQLVSGEKFFYFYSIARWVFRLLPFITLFLLIFIAQLLRKNKKLMRKWSGLLLTIIPAASLVSLIVILIGFDQFIGLIFKQYFSKVIAGFGRVLLWIMQSVGNQVLLWVAGGAGAVFLFGLILLLFARYTKNEENVTENNSLTDSDQENIESIKDIVPETIEEIEKKEADVIKSEKK
jgi:hypothetical protein